MKPLFVAGIVVAALGAFLLLRGMSYSEHHTMVRVGDFRATTEEEHTIPTWVGIVVIAGGALMIGGGLRGRRAA